MKSTILLVSGAMVLVFAVGAGLVLLLPSAPSADGSMNQNPLLYLVLFAGILFAGGAFSRLYNDHSPDTHFSFYAFLNVAIAAILIGGVVHEMTHVALLQHPAQFRVHFGDDNAIFSTCCLAPGEVAHEEIAYLVQFLITLAWTLGFRKLFLTMKAAPASSAVSAKKTPTKSTPVKHTSSAEEELDHEWESQKDLVNHYLDPKSVKKHHVVEKNPLDHELARLSKLKYARAEKK